MGFNTGNTMRKKSKTKAQEERSKRIQTNKTVDKGRRGRRRKMDEINKLK